VKILFDVSILVKKELNFEGIYTKNLFRLLKGLGMDIDPVYKIPKGFKENFIDYHIGHTSKKFYEFFSSKGSILHGPSVNLMSENPKFKKVISVNDLSMFRDGYMENDVANLLQRHIKEQLQKNPLAIFVPTYEVHNEFLVRFPKFVSQIHVITPGCDHILDSSSISSEKISEKPYFVFSGDIDKKSNIVGVIKAFHGLSQSNKNVNLIIMGQEGYGSEAILKLINTASCRDQIKILGYQNVSQRKKIYMDAIATIVPSFYDGFNYSIVEAMKLSCPVLTSAVGSMQEIGRESAHLVNPKDPEQIMAGMERLMVDISYRGKVIEAGQQLTQTMTWLKCARDVADVYSQI
jgi:glycosyltransferase involved in cell wall biosynthesis